MRDKAYRRFKRDVKADRRMAEDRMQHGNDKSCPCFLRDGKTRSRFADTPTLCSSWCCGNPRTHFGEVTRQEKRAATVRDWAA